jgi:uncharacterized protein
MRESAPREKVRFGSGDTQCAAWHYPGTNGACVIMTGGFAVTKEPATDLFASRFHHAGFSVLAFDYRRIGESGGQPRHLLPIPDQIADWHAAIAFASTLPGIDATRLAVWGFSTTAGHLLRVAAANSRVAAVIAQTPNVGGLAATRNASSYQTPAAMLRFTLRGILDTLGGLLGRRPLLVPLVAKPDTVAMLATPDALDGDRALNPDNAYPDWPPRAAARSALRLAFYRPGRVTARIRCPLLVLVCDQDQTTLAASSVRAARRAPNAEVVRLPGGHYAPFLDEHERAVDAELSFLRRHLIEPSRARHGKAADSARN